MPVKRVTKEDIHKKYKKESMYRRIRPTSLREKFHKTSFRDEDWINAFMANDLSGYDAKEIEKIKDITSENDIWSKEGLARREKEYRRDVGFDVLNKYYLDAIDQLNIKNGFRYLNDKRTINIDKDEKGDVSNLPPIFVGPLIEALQAAKRVPGMTPEMALGIINAESTFGVNPALAGFLGDMKSATKEEVNNVMTRNIKEYKAMRDYQPSQYVGLDHDDPDQLLNVDDALSRLIPEYEDKANKIKSKTSDYVHRVRDDFNGLRVVVNPDKREWFNKRLNTLFSDVETVPSSIVNHINNARDFVDTYEPFEQAFKYFQANPVRYNSDIYTEFDNKADSTKWGSQMKKINGLIKHNPDLQNLVNEYKRYGGKTRRYDSGGYIGFRDKFGDIQGSSYGIEKGIQGQAIKEGTMTGLSTGLSAGLLGSQFIGTGAAAAGTAAAGAGVSAAGAGAAAAGGGTLLGMSLGSAIPVIGTVLGAIGGAIAGIFTGKRKRDRAKARAIEQDRQRKLLAANNRILEDEMSLDNKTFNSGSLSLQADSIDNINTPENPTYMSNTIQSKSPFGNSPFNRFGGRIYKDGGTIDYTIKKGDTLWNIAKRFTGDGRNYARMAEMLNIADPNKIYAGDKFNISKDWITKVSQYRKDKPKATKKTTNTVNKEDDKPVAHFDLEEAVVTAPRKSKQFFPKSIEDNNEIDDSLEIEDADVSTRPNRLNSSMRPQSNMLSGIFSDYPKPPKSSMKSYSVPKRIKGWNNNYAIDELPIDDSLSIQDAVISKPRTNKAKPNKSLEHMRILGKLNSMIQEDYPVEYYESPNYNIDSTTMEPVVNSKLGWILHKTGSLHDAKSIAKYASKKDTIGVPFIINKDGSVVRTKDLDKAYWHAGKSTGWGRDGLNNHALGVEFIGIGGKEDLTDAQIRSWAKIAVPIMLENDMTISDILSHNEIRKKYIETHPEDKEAAKHGKIDMSDNDMKRVAALLKELGVPEYKQSNMPINTLSPYPFRCGGRTRKYNGGGKATVDNPVANYLLDEVIVRPSKQDVAKLIASRVSNNTSNIGFKYVIPAITALPMPGEELLLSLITRGGKAVANSMMMRPVMNKLLTTGNRIDHYFGNLFPNIRRSVADYYSKNVDDIEYFRNTEYNELGKAIAFPSREDEKYAEGGQIQQVASNAQIVNGPSHEQGGVQYSPQAEVEGGEAILTDANSAYVFSDELEYNGRTFADIAKPLMKHKGYLEEQLQMQGLLLGRALQMTDRSTYSIDRNTNSRNAEKLNMQMEETRAQVMQLQQMLNQLYNTQEQMKAEQGGMAEPKTTFAFGGQFGLNYMPTNIGLGATNTQMNPMLSNEEEEQTETNETSVPMSPVMRCGGRTRKYAGGGFAPYAGLAVEAGGNLIAGLMQHFGNKASVNAMDELANSNLFDTPHIPYTNLEWDVNTDATLGNILKETRGYERFVRDNTSNSQVARQAVLNARIKGATARAGVKQNEHNTELATRNQIRQINSEIATKNRMIDAENANRRYQNMVDSIVARSQNMSGLASTLTQLGRAVGTGFQTKFDLDNIQMTNLISMLGNDKSRDYIMNALGAAGMRKYFGKAGLSAFNARTAKATEPPVTTVTTPVKPSVSIPRSMRMKGV